MSKEIIFSIFVGILFGIFLFIRTQKKLKRAYIHEIRSKYESKHTQFNTNTNDNNNKTEVNCPGLHGLKQFNASHGEYVCDVCNKQMRVYRQMFGCRTCDWDVCRNCYNKRSISYDYPLLNAKSLETLKLRAEFVDSFKILDTVRDLIIRDFVNDWYKKGISSDDTKFINHIKFAIDGIFQILIKRISSTNWAYFMRDKVFPPLHECITLYTDIVNDFRKNNPKWETLAEDERDNLISEVICSGKYQWHRGCESDKESLNYLRKWSSRILEQVMDETNFNCQPLRIFCKEILANNVFLPVINLVDGHNVNYSILSAFLYLDTINNNDINDMEEKKECSNMKNIEKSQIINDSIFETLINNNNDVNNALSKKPKFFGKKKKEDFHHNIDDIGFLSSNKQTDEMMFKLLASHTPTKQLTIRICHVSHDFDSKHNPYVVYILHIRDEIIMNNKHNVQRIEWTLTTRFSKLHAFHRAIQKDKTLKQKNVKIAAEFPGKAIFPQLDERKKQLIAYFNTLRRYPCVLLSDIMHQLVIPPALVQKYSCMNEEKINEECVSNQYKIPKKLPNMTGIENKSERIRIEHYEHLTPSLIKLTEAILNLEKRSTFATSIGSVATSIGSVFFNGYIANKLYDKSVSLSMDGTLSYFMGWIKDCIWIPPTYEMSQQTVQQPSSNDVLKLKTEARQCVKKIFELYIGDNKIAKVIGQQQLESCVIKFWRLMQQNVLLKHLTFSIIDELLKDLFPEKVSKRYQRKREREKKKHRGNGDNISTAQTSVNKPGKLRVSTNYNMDSKWKTFTEDPKNILKTTNIIQKSEVKRNNIKSIKSKSAILLNDNAPNISLFSGGSLLSNYTKQFIKIREKKYSSDEDSSYESSNEENDDEESDNIYSTDTEEPFVYNQNQKQPHGITDKITNFVRETINKYSLKERENMTLVYGSDNPNKGNKTPQTNNYNSAGSDDSSRNNNNHNNNNSNHNRNGSNGGSGSDDDDKKKNEKNNNKTDIHNNKQVSDEDEKEVDRFFDVLRKVQTMDDTKLKEVLSTFSSNVFEKVSNGLTELNATIQRISLVSSDSTLPSVQSTYSMSCLEYKSECSATDSAIDDNGYSTKSDSIDNGIRNSKSHVKKRRKRRKRKSAKQINDKRYEYKYNIKAKSDAEHEQKIKNYILNKRWYDKQTIKHTYIYGDDEPNGRMSYSIEESEFMRRCQKFIDKLKNNNEQLQLIPICMFDSDSGNVQTQYLFNIKIDVAKNVNIAVSFKYSQLNIEVTGFHLKPKCNYLVSEMDLSGFKMGYLNIYGQSIKQYEERYYKLMPFIRDFRKTEMHTFVLKEWKEQAENVWKDVIGTP